MAKTRAMQLSSNSTVDSVLSEHNRKGSKHLDLRLGTPNLGLQSWALVKGHLPALGERVLAVQTPTHDYRKEEGEPSKATILNVKPGKVTFQLTNKGQPTTYTLIQSVKNRQEWVMIKPKGRNRVSMTNLSKGACLARPESQDPAAS